MNAISRRIAHLDMDAFYASVELLRYPELTGLPVVIGGRSKHKPALQTDGSRHFYKLRDYAGRGVITTATYEARASGVHSGMGVMKAAQLAPDAILLPADFERFRHYSRLFKAAVARVATEIENTGIDEIYIDLSELPEGSLMLAKKIKQAVLEATGLTCSIGIAPNKLLAKICSDLDKPDGISIIGMSDIADRIWPLSVRKINGIGPKAAKNLRHWVSRRLPRLRRLSRNSCKLILAAAIPFGYWKYRTVSITARSKHIPNPNPSAGKPPLNKTFTLVMTVQSYQKLFTALCIRVAEDLQRKAYAGRTVGIKLRFEDFQTVTRDFTLSTHTNDPAAIRQAATECLRRVALEKKLRLLGVRVSTLVPIDSVQTTEILRQGVLPLST